MAMTLNSDAFKQNGHIPGDQMPKPFPQTEPAWGLRAYFVLMGCAADPQTVNYDDLARRINRGRPNAPARPLDLITRWCQQHSVPAIASLVVEQATGLPAPGSRRLAKMRFFASKNGFGNLTGTEFCRRQSKNWQKRNRGTDMERGSGLPTEAA